MVEVIAKYFYDIVPRTKSRLSITRVKESVSVESEGTTTVSAPGVSMRSWGVKESVCVESEGTTTVSAPGVSGVSMRSWGVKESVSVESEGTTTVSAPGVSGVSMRSWGVKESVCVESEGTTTVARHGQVRGGQLQMCARPGTSQVAASRSSLKARWDSPHYRPFLPLSTPSTTINTKPTLTRHPKIAVSP